VSGSARFKEPLPVSLFQVIFVAGLSQAPIGYHEIDRLGRITFANVKEAEIRGVAVPDRPGSRADASLEAVGTLRGG
jgi:hypothetical protein